MHGIKLLKNPIITASIFIYIILSIVTLIYFPSMHSDEGWLASLSRTIIIEQNIGAGEDFFHEVDRNPHALKSIFHLLQIPFVNISFNLFTVRLLSLVAGFITLGFLYQSTIIIFHNKRAAIGVVVLIALDIQFIYISHFARQEILILLVFAICLYIFLKPWETWQYKKDLLIGTILGVSIGIHPNIFIIATGFVFLYFFYTIIQLKSKISKYPSFQNLGILIGTLTLFGLIYIGLSLVLNSNFILDYINFGEGVGVTKPIIVKVLKLSRFYKKMFLEIGGTYFLPDIRPQLIMFALSFIFLIPIAIFIKKQRLIILTLQVLMLGINTGILIVGKYSPPSIIFIFIPGYFLLFILVKTLITNKKIIILLSGIFIIGTSIFTATQILPWLKIDYNKYIQTIKNNIPDNTRTLANLNTVFAFSPGSLYSFRDLEVLNTGFTFVDYIKKHKIEYIIYSDELKIIFEERPVWNTMYGNIYPWYEDMMSFLKTDCEKLYQWNEPVFGMRITTYMGKLDSNITIFKIIN